MSGVSASWERIHEWLEGHAPKILASLNPGASDVEIASAENALGVTMPDDWRELYRIHNGMSDELNHGSLFHGMNFLSLERVVANCTRNAENSKELGDEYTPEAVRAADPGIRLDDLFNKEWIPLAHGELKRCQEPFLRFSVCLPPPGATRDVWEHAVSLRVFHPIS